MRMSADAAKSVASILRLLGGGGQSINRAQTELIIRLLLNHTGLLSLVRLWIAARLLRWAKILGPLRVSP